MLLLEEKAQYWVTTGQDRKGKKARGGIRWGSFLRLWSAPNGRSESTCMSDYVVRFFYLYDEFWYSEI